MAVQYGAKISPHRNCQLHKQLSSTAARAAANHPLTIRVRLDVAQKAEAFNPYTTKALGGPLFILDTPNLCQGFAPVVNVNVRLNGVPFDVPARVAWYFVLGVKATSGKT